MTDNEIIEQLNTIFSKELKKPVSLTPATTASEVDGWDSLTHTVLIDRTEKHFSVRFKLSEITQFNKVGDMVACIQKRVNK